MIQQAVRGAVGLDKNNENEIIEKTVSLIEELINRNNLEKDQIVSIVFSQTADLTAKNPAAALRTTGFSDTPLFCTQEPEYKGSLPLMLRTIITFNTPEKTTTTPIYLGRAALLRPDIVSR